MFDINHLVQSGGLLLIGLFLFSEVGLFLGFFLPGDTLLITAGVYASLGKLPLLSVIIVGAVAATTGDSTAYIIGRKLGRRVFKNQDSVLFNPKHVNRAESFFDKYGSKAVLIAHYMPFIRTLTPLLGGVAKMPYGRFLIFDSIGDISWAVVITLLGYYLGKKVPNIDHYVLYVVGFVVVISVIPTLVHLGMRWHKKRTNT